MLKQSQNEGKGPSGTVHAAWPRKGSQGSARSTGKRKICIMRFLLHQPGQWVPMPPSLRFHHLAISLCYAIMRPVNKLAQGFDAPRLRRQHETSVTLRLLRRWRISPPPIEITLAE